MTDKKIPEWLLKILKKAIAKKIGFTDMLIITITAISLTIIHLTAGATFALLIWRFIFMLPLLYITALMSDDHNGLQGKFDYVWIVLDSKMNFEDKRNALKRHLNITVSKWLKYWRMYQAIVLGDESVKKKSKMITALVFSIIKGEISLPQIIWITIYAFYSIVISTNVLNIPTPYDIMINIGFLTILRYAAGDYKGMGDILFDLMNAIAFGKSDREIEQGLLDTKNRILDECYAYEFLNEGLITKTADKRESLMEIPQPKTPENNIKNAVEKIEVNLAKIEPMVVETPKTELAETKFVREQVVQTKEALNSKIAELEKVDNFEGEATGEKIIDPNTKQE